MKEKSYEKMTDTITSCMINLIYTLLEPIEKMVTAILSCLRKKSVGVGIAGFEDGLPAAYAAVF